jgi:hypothetical protein
LLVSCLAAFLLLAVPPVLMDAARWHTTAIASALPALPLMLWLGPRLAATPLRAPLGWVGRASLLILCLHLIPVWALVVGARRLGIDDPTLVALLSTTGTIAFCYGIDRLTQSTGVPPPGLCSTDPTHGGSAGGDASSGSAPLALESGARHLGQGSSRCARCRQVAARWQAGEPGASNNRQARRGAAAGDAEAAQQLQFVAQQLSIGVLLFRVQGSPLAAKGLSTRHG